VQLRNRDSSYGLIAQILHWSIVALIIYQVVLAQRAESATLFQQLGILTTHRSLGITVLLLTIARLAWNSGIGPRPAPPRDEPKLRLRLARATHALLYLLTIAIPISGWAMSSAANSPVSFFGWLALPNLVSPNALWAERLAGTHGSLVLALAVLVAVHATAALYHQFVLKDGVLRRMLIPNRGDATC